METSSRDVQYHWVSSGTRLERGWLRLICYLSWKGWKMKSGAIFEPQEISLSGKEEEC